MDLTQAIRYGGICFLPDCVAELDGEKPVYVVPREHIQAIRLRYGFRARHPLLLAAFGLALMVLGAWFTPVLYVWFTRGGTLHTSAVWLSLLLFGGAWVVYQACRRCFLLLIDCTNGKHRLEFQGGVDAVQLEAFLSEAESRFGFVIVRE
jgi:hypothetical protein